MAGNGSPPKYFSWLGLESKWNKMKYINGILFLLLFLIKYKEH